jgi:kynureninase
VDFPTSLEAVQDFDAADPLGGLREQFTLPDGLIYLDGNSLGPPPNSVHARVSTAIKEEWGQDLVKAWNTRGWFGLPKSVGAKLAKLIGASDDEVIATDGTSINLFKMTAAALRMRPDRKVIVAQGGNFPTDNYVTEGLVGLAGQGHEVRLVGNDEIIGALDETVSVLSLSQVDYRSGERLDMAAITRAAHDKGILTIWDLCHSAGAFDVDLTGANADFAVGCGYKYLNGGPGAPAFLYVAERHQEEALQPLSGWWGHDAPFAFEQNYRAAQGIARHLTGTQPILSLIALDEALNVFDGIDMAQVRQKSVNLCETFIHFVEQECAGFGFELASPRDPKLRGSHVSFRHPSGFPIMQALIKKGVIGDYRAPEILRFGIAPVYNSYRDVWVAATHLREIMESGEWTDPSFAIRGAVT